MSKNWLQQIEDILNSQLSVVSSDEYMDEEEIKRSVNICERASKDLANEDTAFEKEFASHMSEVKEYINSLNELKQSILSINIFDKNVASNNPNLFGYNREKSVVSIN